MLLISKNYHIPMESHERCCLEVSILVWILSQWLQSEKMKKIKFLCFLSKLSSWIPDFQKLKPNLGESRLENIHKRKLRNSKKKKIAHWMGWMFLAELLYWGSKKIQEFVQNDSLFLLRFLGITALFDWIHYP